MAYIRKVRERWRAEVQRNGTRATYMADTKREAQAWAIRKENELDSLKGLKRRTFEWAREHYVQTVSKLKSEGAADWEWRRLSDMAAFFGDDTPLDQIGSERIGQWRDFRLSGDKDRQPVSASTVQREANLLRNLFTTAEHEWRCIERNPFKGVKLPEHAPARHQLWGWRQIKRVLRANRQGKTMEVIRAFHVALHTGMRLSEVLSARLDGKVAILPSDKTSRGPVRVPLARKGARLLAKYAPFTVGPNEGSVLFSRLCQELMIEDLTFHDSRGSALTWLARRVDVLTLARISRHKDLQILMRSYYRESVEDIAKRI